MAYALHIERPDDQEPISLEDWQAAISRVSSVRPAAGDAHLMNPKTREDIRIPNNGGDAEVFLPGSGEWIRYFRWSQSGTVSFNAEPLSDPNGRSIVPVIFELAKELGALVVGDDGEEYDQASFE